MTRHPKPPPTATPDARRCRRASMWSAGSLITNADRLHATLSLLILVGALLAFWWVGK